MALPADAPWRTITVGDNLKPILETTIPLYESEYVYKHGKSTWSWILWQDNSINYDDHVKFIDLSSSMGYEYPLVDSGWHTNIGYIQL